MVCSFFKYFNVLLFNFVFKQTRQTTKLTTASDTQYSI